MSKRKTSSSDTAAADTPSADKTGIAAAADAPQTAGALLSVETPAIATAPSTETSAAASDAPPIELTKLEQPKIEPAPAAPESLAAAPAAQSFTRQYGLLAASLALAAALGALAGAATTIGLASSNAEPPAQSSAAAELIALKDTVAQFAGELASLKAGVDGIGRATDAQFRKFADRFDRAEKAHERAQAEPAARLARIVDALDRLERRVAAAAPEMTGAVTTVEKQQAKPPVIEGWKLVDFYAGRAVLANRGGALYEVGPGSTLPGVGRVEQIKREDGRVVVVTPKGIIAAALAPRRQSHFPAYRY
jgi:hypothetical protein